MNPSRKRLVLVLAAGVALGGALVRYGLTQEREVAHWLQPAVAAGQPLYGSFEPYRLTVWARGAAWARWPQAPVFVVQIAPQAAHADGHSGYGHRLELTLPVWEQDEAQVAHSQVQWQPDGVLLRAPSGHTVWVPKAAFVGGR